MQSALLTPPLVIGALCRMRTLLIWSIGIGFISVSFARIDKLKVIRFSVLPTLNQTQRQSIAVILHFRLCVCKLSLY